MQKLNFNYLIAKYISLINFGVIRKWRFIKISKLGIFFRLTKILTDCGIFRSYKFIDDALCIYFKYIKGRKIFSKLSIVSTPGRRSYWKLGYLAKNYNYKNFTGFYIVSSQKGLFTSDYCLLKGHVSGEVIVKIEI